MALGPTTIGSGGNNLFGYTTSTEDPYTIMLWQFFNSVVDYTEVGVFRGTNNNIYLFGEDELMFWDGPGFFGTTTFVVNTWYHLTFTRTGSTTEMFVNGVSDGTGGAPGTTGEFTLGHRGISNTRRAALKLWGALLSDDEIHQEMYFDMPVRTANLVRWHHFSTPSSTFRDYSGGGNDIELVYGTPTQGTPGPPITWRRGPSKLFLPVAVSGQTIVIGLASETDTTLALSSLKTVVIGQTSETDTALTITPLRTVPIEQATETDNALTLSSLKTVTVGIATESNSALNIISIKTVSVGQSTETDTALGIISLKTITIGQSNETDISLTITSAKTVLLGQTIETDTSLSIVPVTGDNIAIGIASESNSALSIILPQTIVLGIVSETDLSLSIVSLRTIIIGQASEANSALQINPVKSVSLGQPIETDSALSLTIPKTFSLGLATEIDNALTLIKEISPGEVEVVDKTPIVFVLDLTKQQES